MHMTHKAPPETIAAKLPETAAGNPPAKQAPQLCRPRRRSSGQRRQGPAASQRRNAR